mmetsp:Transcript_16064/g.24208  ORF Transcript_16064/g.24208 Transcript_16064/m.24208 type:complete len:528 (-) Transcript_16064:41-1624(-)
MYNQMVSSGEIEPDPMIERFMITCPIRSLSGVLVITIFTSPYPKYGNKIQRFSCKHNCYYCPNEPGLPRSYLSDEPGVQRGKKHGWNPVHQFVARAWTHHVNGHPVDKIEILVLGGTWSEYPHEYQETFLRDIFYAANTFYDEKKRQPKSLREEQKINESTKCRIIGITLETRPDSITPAEIRRMRMYGCTRVQIGIQHTNDRILKVINRGCTNADAIRSTRLLKDAGYKIDFHLMPDLPTSDPETDLKMFEYVLHSEDLQADQWKIYPCQITPWTVISKWFKEGKYKPYTSEVLSQLLIKVKTQVHPWIRLNRVIRDIPNQYIQGGNEVTNLRQLLLERMRKEGKFCWCIRCREVRNRTQLEGRGEVYVKRRYKSSGGIEYFISKETEDKKVIFGFCRLRLSRMAGVESDIPELIGAALVRELHVYGKMRPVGDRKNKSRGKTQHKSIGRTLMGIAEELAVEAGYKKIAVIAGIGTRLYYAKLGYHLEGTYMVKYLENNTKKLWIYALVLILIAFVLNSPVEDILD